MTGQPVCIDNRGNHIPMKEYDEMMPVHYSTGILQHMPYQPLGAMVQASPIPGFPINPLATALMSPQMPTVVAVEQPQLHVAPGMPMEIIEDQYIFPIPADVVVPSVTTTLHEAVPLMSTGGVTTVLQDAPIAQLSQGLQTLTVPSASVDMFPTVSPLPIMTVEAAPTFTTGLTATPSGFAGSLTTSPIWATANSFAQPMTISAAPSQQSSTMFATSATPMTLRLPSQLPSPVQSNVVTTLGNVGTSPKLSAAANKIKYTERTKMEYKKISSGGAMKK